MPCHHLGGLLLDLRWGRLLPGPEAPPEPFRKLPLLLRVQLARMVDVDEIPLPFCLATFVVPRGGPMQLIRLQLSVTIGVEGVVAAVLLPDL